jgi:exodeoxyribonuclease VII small subunit
MDEKLQFEEAIHRLETMTAQLESGEGSLEEMVQRYEECMKLVKLCNDRLDAYEKKITMLGNAEKSS